MRKKLLSLLLVFTMILTIIPVQVLAYYSKDGNNDLRYKENREEAYNKFKEIMISDDKPNSYGITSSWLNLDPPIKIGNKMDDNELVGHIGLVKATMIVIDDPNAKAEDNDGKDGNGEDMGNRTPDGRILKTAQDYYDYFVPAAIDFYRESSYGLLDLEVKLVKCPTNNGVYRLSGDNASTYPATGGDLNKYLEEALEIAKDDLKKHADNRHVIFVVAVENFKEISRSSSTLSYKMPSAIGLNGYRAIIRMGRTAYETNKRETFIHELGHGLGLPDIYTDDDLKQVDVFSGKRSNVPAVGYWGIMGHINSPSHDFLGYQKWQFGWILNEQVDIITEDGETIHELTASSVNGGTKLIAIPGDRKGVTYIVEYKRAAGVEIPPFKQAPKPEFKNEGILIYKIDANNASRRNPITVINLHPIDPLAEPEESEVDALSRSVLGPKQGVFSYEDKAAGITISVDPEVGLPEEVNAPYTVIVKKTTPAEENKKPVLSVAHFLDFTTIECLTNYDLRGMKHEYVSVVRNGIDLAGVKLNRVSPGVLRVIIGDGQVNSIEDMENVEIYTAPFSFFNESNKAKVNPTEISDDIVILSKAEFEDLDKITFKSNMDLSSCTPKDISITKKDGLTIPAEAYKMSYNNKGKEIRVSFIDKSYFLTGKSTEDIMLNVNTFSNYNPPKATAIQMRYGDVNGIKLTKFSEPIKIKKLQKAVNDVSIIGDIITPEYAVGDVMDFSKIKVNITYTDGSTIETSLHTRYMDIIKSDDTSSLGENKDAVFNFDGKEIKVKFDVVEHPLNLPKRFYSIKTSDSKRRIEWFSKPQNDYISMYVKSTITDDPDDNSALYFRPTSWTKDKNKNLYEIYKGSSVLKNTDDLIRRESLPTNDFDREATSWQIINLGDGTYAIINAYTGKAITYSGEADGVPIKTTDFNIDNVKEGQKFKIYPVRIYAELNNKIKNAETGLNNVVSDTDGTSCPFDKLWVTNEQMEEYISLIEDYKKIIEKDLGKEASDFDEYILEKMDELENIINYFNSLKQTSNQPVTSMRFANGKQEELSCGAGDVLNIYNIQVEITITSGTSITVNLLPDYMVSNDGTNSLGTKTAVFKYGNEDNNATIEVTYEVVEHPLNIEDSFYCIKTFDSKRRLEWYSKTGNYLSTWSGSTTTDPTGNGALYFRPTSWSEDANKNLYEIYKGSSVLMNTDDSILREKLPSNDSDKNATSWQIMNLGDETYAIISAYNGKAITYSGEENGVPIKTTNFNINNVKEGQRFKLVRGSTK